MIPVSETDMQPFNSQPIIQVKFEEEMGPICGDSIKEGGHLEAWHFMRKTKSVGQGTGNSNKPMGETMKKYLS